MSGVEKPALYALTLAQEEPPGKTLYSGGDIYADDAGKLIAVWVYDNSESEETIDPEIAVRFNEGSGWGAATLITGNALWETDPRVVYLNGGKALAIWTSNDGAKTLEKMNEILAHQDIAYAYYDGSTWTDEALVFDDDYADGLANLAHDVSTNSAMAVWGHNGDNSEDLNDHTKWSVYYSLFDGTGLQWTDAVAITGTDGGQADFMPAIAADGNGRFIAVWVKDTDGSTFSELAGIQGGTNVDYTNSDCDVYYAIYQNGTWGTPAKVTTTNDFTEGMVDVAYLNSGKGVAVWVEKGENVETLYYSVNSDGAWSDKTKIDDTAYFIEDPKIDIDDSDAATVIYRKFAGYDGEIFSSQINLGGLQQVAEPPTPAQLTNDDVTDWNPAMALGSDGKPVLLWSKMDTAKAKATTAEGFSSGINLAVGGAKMAELTGTNSITLVDADEDGLYEMM